MKVIIAKKYWEPYKVVKHVNPGLGDRSNTPIMNREWRLYRNNQHISTFQQQKDAIEFARSQIIKENRL